MWLINRSRFQEAINPYPLGHHNFVAGYLLLVLPILGVLAWESLGWWRWLWWGGLGIGLFDLYTTGSRGGVLGLLGLLIGLGLSLASYGLWRYGWSHAVRQYGRWAAIAPLGLMALVAVLITNSRTQRLVAAIQSGQLEGNILFRLFTVQTGLNLWRDYPWLGIGPGNTIRLYDLYRPIEAGPVAFRVQQVHSTPPQILVELGLLGLLVYLLWLVAGVGLGWQLLRQVPAGRDRHIITACLAGLFAYTISSLSDYQLENIGISLTGVLFLAILLHMHRLYCLPTPPSTLPNSTRRVISLLLLLLITLAFSLWLRVDLGMMLMQRGTAEFRRGGFVNGYNTLTRAIKLVPWESYYSFQLGAQLASLTNNDAMPTAASSASTAQSLPTSPTPLQPSSALDGLPQLPPLNSAALPGSAIQSPASSTYGGAIAEQAMEHLQEAVRLTPTDELFNRFLGTMQIDTDPRSALVGLRRSAQLNPRKSFTHALMGMAYVKHNNLPAAERAFALEGLINPAFLTADVWLNPPVDRLWEDTLAKTLTLYTECLAQVTPSQAGYNPLYQNQVMLRWFQSTLSPMEFLKTVEMERLNPLAQAVLLLDAGERERAIASLNPTTLGPDLQPGARLLTAWLNPNSDLSDLEKNVPDLAIMGGLPVIQRTINEYRQLKPWLLSMHRNITSFSEGVGFFSYRNTNGLQRIALPRGLPVNLLVRSLHLFNDLWILPPLDRILIRQQKAWLELDRPLVRFEQ